MSWLAVLILACTDVGPPSADVEPALDVELPAEPTPEPEPEPLPDPTDPVLAAHHIQLPWRGADGAPSDLDRTEEAARELAYDLHERLLTGADFEELAREHSSDPSGRRGGRLGAWRTGVMNRDFERCVGAATVGELGPVCRTPFGWQVIRRDPVEVAEGSHLVLPLPADPQSQAEVRSLAASTRSTWANGTAPEGATDLGRVGRGQLIPAVEQALFGLRPGEVSEVFQAAGSLHVVARR